MADMAQVDVTVNGRSYRIACEDGQEQHLRQLGEYVDRRIAELIATVGQIGDARLLVMACLLVSDELAEAYARIEGGESEGAGEDAVAEIIESLAQQLETIAARLEAA
jgi:cell division protein ZapA